MEPVSIRYDGGIGSKYFRIQYRPSQDKSNPLLNINCSSLLTYLALADIYRDEENYEVARNKLLEALSRCRTDEEIQNLDTFLKTVANVGGYAATFYEENHSLLTPKGRDEAKQKMSEIETAQKKKQQALQDKKIDEFDDDFDLLQMEFDDFLDNDMKDDRDVDRLIGKYLNLKQALSDINGMIDSETYSQYSQHINDALAYLHRLSNTFDHVNDIINSM